MAVNDVYKLTVRQSILAQIIQNTFYFRRKIAADPSAADALVLANDIKERFRARQADDLTYTTWALEQVVGGTVTYTQPLCRKEGGLLFVGAFTGVLAGPDIVDPLPTQVAIVSTLRTGQAGRRRRGRHYLGGLTEGDTAAGVFLAGFVTNVQGDWNTTLTLYGTLGTDPNWQIGVFSTVLATGCRDDPTTVSRRPVAFQAPSPTTAFAGITEVATRNTPFTQRKRTLGVGQ